jgi:hypothetical protein
MPDEIETQIQIPSASRDELEAASVRYSNKVILLVPLSSGKIAIYGRNGMELYAILDAAPSLDEIAQFSAQSFTRCAKQLADYELSKFLGEPSATQQARDLKRSTAQAKAEKFPQSFVVEIL